MNEGRDPGPQGEIVWQAVTSTGIGAAITLVDAGVVYWLKGDMWHTIRPSSPVVPEMLVGWALRERARAAKAEAALDKQREGTRARVARWRAKIFGKVGA